MDSLFHTILHIGWKYFFMPGGLSCQLCSNGQIQSLFVLYIQIRYIWVCVCGGGVCFLFLNFLRAFLFQYPFLNHRYFALMLVAGNVAFNKRTYSNTNITLAGRDSSLAVDGNTDPTYVIGGNPTDSCAYVRVDEDIGETAYWAVDLGGTYVIYSLTLYGRSGRQSSKCMESWYTLC